MKHPAPDPAPRFGSILPGEVMPLAEAARRLGWQSRTTIDCQKIGLRSVLIGRRKYTTGDWCANSLNRRSSSRPTTATEGAAND